MNKIKLLLDNKKGATFIWWLIFSAVIAAIVVVFVLIWFKSGGEKLYEGMLGGKIDDLGDWDNDKVANMYDKCPCQPVSGGKLEGCPVGVLEQQAQAEYKKYKEGKCEEYLAQAQTEKEASVG